MLRFFSRNTWSEFCHCTAAAGWKFYQRVKTSIVISEKYSRDMIVDKLIENMNKNYERYLQLDHTLFPFRVQLALRGAAPHLASGAVPIF